MRRFRADMQHVIRHAFKFSTKRSEKITKRVQQPYEYLCFSTEILIFRLIFKLIEN